MKRKTAVSLLVLFVFLAVLVTGEGSLINAAKSENRQNQGGHSQLNGNLAPSQRLWAFGDFDKTKNEIEETLDDRFAEVAKQIPGFGGMFLDKDGTLQVYMLGQQAATPELTALLESVITREVLSGENLGQTGMEVIEGRYDFLQLKGWHDQMSAPVLESPGIVFTDIDEAKNRVVIGVENLETAKDAIEEYLSKLGIPHKAVIIEETKPIQLELRNRRRPLVGGLQINFTGFLCTLGFIANRGGVRGFVTNSHCTATQGGVQGTVYHQPSSSGTTNRVGIEIADPTYFTGGSCPGGRRCRFSDSAFVQVPHPSGPSVSTSLGIIARPPTGSFSWNGTSTFQITGESSPVVGQSVTKVGRTTGRTSGTVQRTCFNVNVSGTNITQLCQSQASYSSAGGDSGSPVFRITTLPSVVLGGIHWGSGGTFSPISGIQRSGELGAVTTCVGGGC